MLKTLHGKDCIAEGSKQADFSEHCAEPGRKTVSKGYKYL